jgi:hypothetical protein
MKAFNHNTTVETNGDTVQSVTYFWKYQDDKVHAVCSTWSNPNSNIHHYGNVSISVNHEMVHNIELNNNYINSSEYIKGIVEKWITKHL